MSTETKSPPNVKAPQVAPAAQLPARKEAWETFREELNQRAEDIGSQLPPNISRDKFIGAALAAVKSTPSILTATPRSLMSALTKAAQDGLLPDGREGIITVFNTTVDGRKEAIAQWNPMFYGIRKRARELDGIIIDAQVVIEGDEFDYELGDEPHIHHKPKPRTEAIDASKGVAVYAVFRHPTEGILHREVMWKPEVFAVMNQSRAKGSLMWTTFWGEGWKKTVGRRGSKSVPVSAQLERLITRDDENFDFPRGDNGPRLLDRPTPPTPPAEDTDPPSTDQPSGGSIPPGVPAATPMSDSRKHIVVDDSFNDEDSNVSTASPPMPRESYFLRIDEELSELTTEDEVIEHYETLGVDIALVGNDEALDRATAIRNRHLARVNGQGDLLAEREFPGDIPLTRAQKLVGTP